MLLAAGCGGTQRHGVAGARIEKCASLAGANAAVVRAPLAAFRSPGRGLVARFGLRNVNGVDSVFSVLRATCDGRWLRVQLPIRPNGAAGWVSAARVQTYTVRTRIVVDVSARTLRFYDGGRLQLRATVAVGSSATPTPVGRYYVNQKLIPADPAGPYGPGALGISAYSPVLTHWAQGGPVAIHGTNEPWSIGRAVSNGCIRLPNATLSKLFAETLPGTPVLIRR
ncbi:MAG: L,D-transpeptidase family protein [Actinomycetota bacterium]